MLGIDVSKSTLAACLLPAVSSAPELAREFPNTAAGYQALQRWLDRHQARTVAVCMEATGPYTFSLAQFLYSGGHRVSIVNPRRIKAYAQSRLSRAKTDRVDARLIAQFAQGEAVPCWTPPSAEQQAMRAIQARLDTLQREITHQRQVLESCQEPVVVASVARVETLLMAEVAAVKNALDELLKRHTALQADVALLCSIPGVGVLTARRLVAQIEISRFESAGSFAAFLGLTPKEHSSGTSVHRAPRLSKIGSKSLRTALYFPAMQATRCNAQIKAHYERLLARGKPKKAAICAGMRKLAQQIYGVWSSRQPYDPAKGLPA